jgi:hypothetical protein
MNDTVLENTETFFVHLLRTPDLDRSVTLDPDIADLEITDNDVAIVGLEKTFYQATDGVVGVCALVHSPNCVIDFAFDVSLSTRFLTNNDNAVTPFNYGALDTILIFTTCQMRSCVNISIVDTLNVTLERTPNLDSRITLDPPAHGVLEFADNDVAAVGLERTFSEWSS